MTSLSIELAKAKLIETDEVKKAQVAKLKKADRGPQEIKDPTAGVSRSERHDAITQVVQDGSFVSDQPAGRKDLSDDIVPQADFADEYTKVMPHGKSGGMGEGENQKSPKIVGTDNMTPNQTTKMKEIPGGMKAGVVSTEDDGNQDIFIIPQADFADEYTKSMPHGRAGGTTDEDVGGAGEPAKRSTKKMDGGPTRRGGQKSAKLGGDAVGAKDKDTQDITQVTGPNKEGSPSDAFTWGKATGPADYKKETHGAQNVREARVESGVMVALNGKPKATFEVVNHKVLRNMSESYAQHGYNLQFVRTEAAWKKDITFLRALRESIHARFNHAPNLAKSARKAAMHRFGQLCKESFSDLYESRHEFVQTMGAAFKKIEAMAEDKYVDSLEYFDCKVRFKLGEDVGDIAIVTQATDKNMACRQVRNRIQEDYGFDADIQHIFVDGEKFTTDQIVEFAPVAAIARGAAAAASAAGASDDGNNMGERKGRKKKTREA